MPVVVDFKAPTTPQQRQWLSTTRRPIAAVTIHPDDAASAELMEPGSQLLRRSAATFTSLQNVHIPGDNGRLVYRGLSLDYLTALQTLSLRHAHAAFLAVLRAGDAEAAAGAAGVVPQDERDAIHRAPRLQLLTLG